MTCASQAPQPVGRAFVDFPSLQKQNDHMQKTLWERPLQHPLTGYHAWELLGRVVRVPKLHQGTFQALDSIDEHLPMSGNIPGHHLRY